MTAAEIEKQEEELRAQIEEQKLNEVRDLGRLLGSLVSMPGRGALGGEGFAPVRFILCAW